MRLLLTGVLLIVVLAALGGVSGFGVASFVGKTNRSTMRLMVESNATQITPQYTLSVETIRSLLNSDRLTNEVFGDPAIQPFHAQFNNDVGDFVNRVQIQIEPEEIANATSIVLLMHCNSENSELSESAVSAYAKALKKRLKESSPVDAGNREQALSEEIEQLRPEIAERDDQHTVTLNEISSTALAAVSSSAKVVILTSPVTYQANPRSMPYAKLGAMIGGAIGVLITILLAISATSERPETVQPAKEL